MPSTSLAFIVLLAFFVAYLFADCVSAHRRIDKLEEKLKAMKAGLPVPVPLPAVLERSIADK